MDEERGTRPRRRAAWVARLAMAVVGSAVGMFAGRDLSTAWQVVAGVVGAVLLLVALDVVLVAMRYERPSVGDPTRLHAPKPGARRRRLPWSRATRTRVWMIAWWSVGTAAGALTAWDLPRMWTVVMAFAGGFLAVVAHAVVWIVSDMRSRRSYRPTRLLDRDGDVWLECPCGGHLLPITPGGVLYLPRDRAAVEERFGPLIPSPESAL